MITLISIIILLVLVGSLLKILYSEQVIMRLPYDKETRVGFTGPEAMIILMMAAAWIGLGTMLAFQMAIMIIFCILGMIKSKNNMIISLPMTLYIIFLIWIIIGIFYSTSVNFGFRMFIKYLYPLLFCMLCAKVVRDGEVFLTAGTWARRTGIICFSLLLFMPIWTFVFPYIWTRPAIVTGLIAMLLFSLGMVYATNQKRRNIVWFIVLSLPAIVSVYRTDLFGIGVALSAFFIIQYRIKALPYVAIVGFLGLCSIFYIPAVRDKMFRGKEFTMEQFMKGEVEISEKNIQMNSRGYMWRMTQHDLRKRDFTIGAGTGRVQKLFYTETDDLRKNGQMHNDFLVIWLDNGYIGIFLFCLAYMGIFIHCIIIYRKDSSPYARLAALVAGSSLIGIFATCYSDNTVSYSLVTFSFPWGFYGMALGMRKGNETVEEIEIEEQEAIEYKS